jgi:hypothetical protein
MTTATSTKPVEVGDFFEESWGYDQTNIDFYEVVRISASGKTVWLRHVASKIVESNQYSDKVAPVPGSFTGEEFKRTLKLSNWRSNDDVDWYVNMRSFSSAYLWHGQPLSQTGANWGH